MSDIHKRVQDILGEDKIPTIGLNQEGIITFVNDIFQQKYGWDRTDLLNQPVTTIIPSHMRDAHHVGFSRFLTTETPTLLEKPLKLPILCKDGKILEVEHFITAEKIDGNWQFAALIRSPQ